MTDIPAAFRERLQRAKPYVDAGLASLEKAQTEMGKPNEQPSPAVAVTLKMRRMIESVRWAAEAVDEAITACKKCETEYRSQR